jgi:hypothetical protein
MQRYRREDHFRVYFHASMLSLEFDLIQNSGYNVIFPFDLVEVDLRFVPVVVLALRFT